MKGKHRPISGRELGNSLVQRNAVDYRHRIRVLSALHYLNWRFTILSRLLHPNSALAEMHEHLIDGETVKPGSKGRFAPKTPDFSKELNEDLLSEIFSLRHISCHPQTKGINSTIMTLVELLKSAHVSLGSSLRQRIV